MRVLDPDGAALDALDAVGRVAELEDVAGHALDRPILVDAADDLILRFQQHLVVGGVGDSSARGQRRQPGPAPAAQHMVYGVVMEQRAAAAAPAGEAFSQHRDDGGKILPRQRAIRPGAAEEGEELVLLPFPRCNFGDDLLRQHIERLFRNRQSVEFAAADAVEQCRALDQFVARQRE